MFDAIKQALVERAAEKLAQKGLDMGFKAILSSLGMGQDDIKGFFVNTLEEIGKRPLITKEQYEGVEMTMKALFGILQDEDVMTGATKKELLVILESWNMKRKS